MLDAGCGAGHGSGLLAGAGARHVIGVDSSAERIGEAEGMVGGPTDFVLADLAALPFADASFEVAVCLDVVEDSAEAPAIVSELRRVLREDGHLLISLAVCRPAGLPDAGTGPGLAAGALKGLLQSHFAEVGLYAQHGCLGSLVQPLDDLAEASDGQIQMLTRRLGRDDPAETGLLAVASVAGPLPRLESAAIVASLVGLRRSPGRFDDASGRSGDGPAGDGAQTSRRTGASGGDARLGALTRRLIEAETENARIPELEGYLRECECEVRKFESSLLGKIGKAIFHIRSAIR